MILRVQDQQAYLEKVYASWLGKVIGVRLGSPVENWSSEEIKDKYPDEEGYLVNYDVYAADDDTNGPLFFVRALLEEGELSAEKIGNTFLNYLQEYKGFFWWGGVGVSSEHTAYENLKNGIKAPESGSVKRNGQTIAEQIGGQIFSDCWGYVAGYDCDLAKKLASMASSVTHDRNGIEGGIFVAVALTLAMQMDNIHEVIEGALSYLDPDLEYYQVARDILAFYENNKDDYHKCLDYIQKNYGYDRYPGVCHIIPNMALMIMAMSYGEGDFSKTLVLLNRCGWDTDCNCGNVGSILGALVGLKGIDEKWILPINDVLNASSCVGFLNIQTVSESAKLFTKLAYRLRGMDVAEDDLFNLPYGTKGIRPDGGKIQVKDHKLYVDSGDIYGFSYYLKKDLYDARYDPQFSPLLNPGDAIELKVEGEDSFLFYVRDCIGKSWEKPCFVKDGKLLLDLPEGKNLVFNRIGLKSGKPYAIKDIKVLRRAKIDYDFSDWAYDHYGPRYGGDEMNNIRAFVEHSGSWSLKDGLLGESREHALISSGTYGSRYRQISWTFVPLKGKEHLLLFSMRGFLERYGVGFKGDEAVLMRNEEVLVSAPLKWEEGKTYTLELKERDGRLLVGVAGQEFDFGEMEVRDLYGVYLGENCINRTLAIRCE